MLLKPKSDRVDREADALAKYEDAGLAEKRRRRAYGDMLDRIGLRESVDDSDNAVLLACATATLLGALAFAWFAGNTVFPGLTIGVATAKMHWGGLLTAANEIALVWLVKKWRQEKSATGVRRWRDNSWSWLVAASFAFSFTCIYVSQTTSADEVRRIVAKRDALEIEIDNKSRELREFYAPSLIPYQTRLDQALDRLVGWNLNKVKVGTPEELRASVDCAVNLPQLAREDCNQVGMLRAQLQEVEAMHEAKQVLAEETLPGLKADLEKLPDATNAFVQMLANITGWTVEDAQSRFYIALALLLIVPPALIFSKTLERQDARRVEGSEP